MSAFPHGTENGYDNRGCRCEACSEAHTKYYMTRRPCPQCGGPKHPYAELCTSCSPSHQRRHGIKAYKRRGCRCEICRAASVAEKRRYRATHREHERAYDRERKRLLRQKVASSLSEPGRATVAGSMSPGSENEVSSPTQTPYVGDDRSEPVADAETATSEAQDAHGDAASAGSEQYAEAM